MVWHYLIFLVTVVEWLHSTLGLAFTYLYIRIIISIRGSGLSLASYAT